MDYKGINSRHNKWVTQHYFKIDDAEVERQEALSVQCKGEKKNATAGTFEPKFNVCNGNCPDLREKGYCNHYLKDRYIACEQ